MSFIKSLFQFTEGIIDLPINTNPKLETDEPITYLHDLIYNDADPEVCRLDAVFLPDRNRYPVVVYIHGGGFVAGDKYKRRGISKWFASIGYFVVNINYGLCPDYLYPAPVRHLADALNWTADNAEHYRLDTTKIVAVGDSAGAYYAALLAALSTCPRLAAELGVSPRAAVGAAILNCGLYDIEAALNQKSIFGINTQIFESFTGLRDEEFDRFPYRTSCSPINYVTAAFPPSFVLYAKRDLFCAGQSERLVDALRNAHVYCEEFHSNDLFNNHCFSLQWINRKAQKANAEVASFLRDFDDGLLAERAAHQENLDRYLDEETAAPHPKNKIAGGRTRGDRPARRPYYAKRSETRLTLSEKQSTASGATPETPSPVGSQTLKTAAERNSAQSASEKPIPESEE